LILLYNGLILPHIDYGLIIWGTSAKFLILKVQRLQNRYARLILNADFLTPHLLMLKRLNWQSVLQRVNYQFCLYMFKVINGLSPQYLKVMVIFRTPHIFTRYAIDNPLYVIKPNKDYMKRSFQYVGSIIWNNLPLCIRNTTSINSFKRQCKLLSLIDRI